MAILLALQNPESKACWPWAAGSVIRQCVEFQFIPRCCAEDSGSFYFVQAGEWFGDVFTVVGDVLDEFGGGSAAAAAYDDAFGAVGESIGGLLGNDDRGAY